MGILCRPILLYNEFLPSFTGDRIWQYKTFGHYDGIDIENHIELEDGTSFEELFRKCTGNEGKINSYFTQILFGFLGHWIEAYVARTNDSVYQRDYYSYEKLIEL